MSETHDKPNFLFIITDQQRADHVGFGGDRVLETPHLDALAARSTVFDQAFVANPICMPNRASILTGRMPSSHGTRFNGITLDWTANTFVRCLRAAGYRTDHIGKAHLQTWGAQMEWVEPLLGPVHDADAKLDLLPQGWDWLEHMESAKREASVFQGEFYGFENFEPLMRHGDTGIGAYAQWLVDNGVDRATTVGPRNATAVYEGWPGEFSQVYQSALSPELYPSTYLADRTIEAIEQAAGGDRPFFIHCSFPDPHHPFTPPGRYWDIYDPADIEMPATFDDPLDATVPHFGRVAAARGDIGFPMMVFACTEDQYRHTAAAEYGALALVDESIGRILAALESSGVADNTVVVFTSDHGDMFGDHGLMLKMTAHYEACTRVPLTISVPGAGGARSDSLVSSLDLAPTMLDLAGIEQYNGIQGHSLASIIEDSTTTVRDHVLIEEDEIGDLPELGAHVRMRTLQTSEARLTMYAGTPYGQLFDLTQDPGEMIDRFDDPDYRSLRAELTERLAHSMMAHADESIAPRSMA